MAKAKLGMGMHNKLFPKYKLSLPHHKKKSLYSECGECHKTYVAKTTKNKDTAYMPHHFNRSHDITHTDTLQAREAEQLNNRVRYLGLDVPPPIHHTG